MIDQYISSVLRRVAGQFVNGLNKENLNVGLFSGEVKIENTSLNANAIDMLNLPIKHQFSIIQKLELYIPYRNLDKKPVQLFLDGLFLILTPKEESEWVVKGQKTFLQKFTAIQQYAAQCVAKIIGKENEKQKNEEEEVGYIQRLTMMIIDKMQITIKNMHIRFEDKVHKKYSWGFCFDKVEINIKDGVKTFIDRTIQNKYELFRKIFDVTNAGMYWNSNEQRFISDLTDQEKIRILNGMILKEGQSLTEEPVDFFFKTSSQINLTVRNKGNFEIPEIKFSLNPANITLNLKLNQYQQVSEQTELFSKYRKLLANQKNIDAQEIERLYVAFQTHFTKIMQQEKDKSISCLTESEKQEFEEAIENLEIENLLENVKKIVIELQKALKIKELENKKLNEMTSFFDKLFGNQKDTDRQASQVTEEEKTLIDKLIQEKFGDKKIEEKIIQQKIEDTLGEQGISDQLTNRPMDQVNFILDYGFSYFAKELKVPHVFYQYFFII